MDKKIAVIGFGSMGKMLYEKISASKIVDEKNFYLANRTFSKIEALSQNSSVNLCKTNAEAAGAADIIFVCIRPAEMKTVLQEIAPVLNEKKHLISLNGSISFAQLETICRNIKISKVIPSVTAEVDESQTLMCHNPLVTDEDKNTLSALLKTFGNVIELPENEMGMGSELVSCMPGFIASLFNEIKKAAQLHTKIPENQIVKMLADTLRGTARLITEKQMTFEQVCTRVATKGGITEEGTKVIEKNFPPVAQEMFDKTLEKRRLTSEKAVQAFGDISSGKRKWNFDSSLELKTERLVLRPIRVGDEKAVHEYAGDPEITMMFWLPNDTFEDTVDFVKKNAAAWESPDQTNFEFVILYEGKIIGGCDCDLGHSEDHSYGTLGWILNKKYRKQGFASEAASAVVKFAFENLGINRILAQCDSKNAASFGVMKKIGMKLINDKGTRTYPKTGITSGEFTCEILKQN